MAKLAAIALVASSIFVGMAFNSVLSYGSSSAGEQGSAAMAVSNTPLIQVSSGLTRDQVFAAYGDYNTRVSYGLQSIQVFGKSGGSPSGGLFNPNLRIDFPTNATSNKVAFQYYVADNDPLTPGYDHCSDVRLHAYVDGNQLFVSKWLGYKTRSPPLPLQTDEITIVGIPNGQHQLAIIPEGKNDGCVTQGYVKSWAGTLVLFDLARERYSANAQAPSQNASTIAHTGSVLGNGGFENGPPVANASDPRGYWGSTGSRFGGHVGVTHLSLHTGRSALAVSNNGSTAAYVYQYVDLGTNNYTLSFWYDAVKGNIQVEVADGWGPPPWFLGGEYNPRSGVSIAPWTNTSSLFPVDGQWHHVTAINTPNKQALLLDSKLVSCLEGTSVVPTVVIVGDLSSQNVTGKYYLDDISLAAQAHLPQGCAS